MLRQKNGQHSALFFKKKDDKYIYIYILISIILVITYFPKNAIARFVVYCIFQKVRLSETTANVFLKKYNCTFLCPLHFSKCVIAQTLCQTYFSKSTVVTENSKRIFQNMRSPKNMSNAFFKKYDCQKTCPTHLLQSSIGPNNVKHIFQKVRLTKKRSNTFFKKCD